MLSLPAICLAQSGYITTIAGNGVTQYIGDGWPATSYSLGAPTAVCSDKWGNIFDADFINQRVRMVDTDDSLFTFALNGTFGYSGDGGQATGAAGHNPYGIAADTAGNIYFSEQYNAIIRKVDRATGIISTICGSGASGFSGDGGDAVEAQLNEPSGIDVDKAGNIYIADKANQRIRKIDAITNIISTVAGNGINGYTGDGGAATAAKLSYPQAVSVDSVGNIYIAEYGSSTIRKVDGVTGIISTLAGNGFGGDGGDGGPATAARLNQPSDVHVSGRGNIYVADYANNRVRMITPDGQINTIAGSGMYGFSGDGGPAIAAKFINPSAVCTDENENIYITDFGNSAIRKIEAAVVGVQDINSIVDISVFPNPSNGLFNVTSSSIRSADVVVYNSLGSVVSVQHITGGNLAVDLTDQPAGVYLLQVKTSAQTATTRIIKL